MFLTEIKRSILVRLRDGPLDQFEIAAGTGLAPFIVHAELRALKRERLVGDRLTPRAHLWELTTRGYELAWHEAQGAMHVA